MYRHFFSESLRKIPLPIFNQGFYILLVFFICQAPIWSQSCPANFGLSVGITNVTCSGNSDGTVLAQFQTDSLEFSLTDSIYQTNPAFNSLDTGMYMLYARKISDTLCRDSVGFEIETVVDIDEPNIDCQDINVALDPTGALSIPITYLIASLSDNCSDSVDITLNLTGSVSFDCDDAGKTVTLALTATDESSNSVSCLGSITIDSSSACTPTLTVNSPCACKNNATTLENGQFIDTIIVNALSGQKWTITDVNGFYASNSPAPPSPAIPIIVGDTLVETPIGSNHYPLIGLHIDSIGYALTLKNTLGDSFVVSSFCTYPTPIFSLPKDTFFQSSAPITLIGTAGDSNPFAEQFFLDTTLITTIDYNALSFGSHTLSYVVNGGTANTTDPADAGCVSSVMEMFEFSQTPSQMVCNNMVQLSLPVSCAAHVHPDQILEGSYQCYDDYLVEVFEPNGQFIGNLINGNHVGQTLNATVTHMPSGNTCTGAQISVEDKIPPAITCADITVSAAITNITPNYLQNNYAINESFPTVQENCGSFDLEFFDNTIYDNPCDTLYNMIVERIWTVKDASQNMAFCSQLIKTKVVNQLDVRFPADTVLDCTNFDTTYLNTKVPTVLFDGKHEMPLYPYTGLTSFFVDYEDELLPICDGTRKVLRTWSVTDWCEPIQININPLKVIQVIKIEDANKPRFVCPTDLTISTGFDTCNLNYNLPDVIVRDFCSRLSSAKARYYLPDSSLHEIIGTFGAPGASGVQNDTLAIFGLSDPLPIGTSNFTYTAVDNCGNQGTCAFNVTIVDNVPPIARCDPYSKLSLGLNGKAAVNAGSFDDGSFDNCSPVFFKSRRFDANACQDHTKFYDKVEFCCVDVTNTLEVVFRVYDVPVPAGPVDDSFQKSHSNDCIAEIIIEDNLIPTCVAPPDVTANCLSFDATLWSYGDAVGTDNCNLSISQSVTYTNFDSLCHIGEIIRIFTVSDSGGTTSTCTQLVTVTGNQEFYIEFPNDEFLSDCGGSTGVTEPVFHKEDCELIGTSYTDDTLHILSYACYQVNRKWRVTNWCSYDTTDNCVDVPNPNPNSQVTNPANFQGPFISNICDQNNPWAATSIPVYPGTPPFDYCTVYDSAASCYEYTQTIMVLDGEAPQIKGYTTPDPCDLSENDGAYWSANYWWDALNMSHNLSESEAELTFTATDECSGKDLDFKYQLFLDLDGNGSHETLIDSDVPPAARFVNFNNASTTTGGTPQQFDFRLVPQAEWFRFGIKIERDSINSTASVVWKTTDEYFVDTAGILPQLPHGSHKIKWIAKDGCGNEIIEEIPFTIGDCKKPSIKCKNGLSINMPNTNPSEVEISVSDLLLEVEDNATPLDFVEVGICLDHIGAPNVDSCSGIFPTNSNFTADTIITLICGQYFPSASVQIWALDRSGNTDFCQTTVSMTDNFGICNPGLSRIVSGKLLKKMPAGAILPLSNTDVNLNGINDPISMQDITDANGTFTFNNVPLNGDYRITPHRNNDFLNGVNTYDMLLIQKHLLGTEPITNPYNMIAADINNSGSITPTDIVELRKLILGIHPNGLPDNTSWKFIDSEYDFTNPANPFQDSIPETLDIISLNQGNLQLNFESIKIGDIDETATFNINQSPTDRGEAAALIFEDQQLVKGAQYCVAFDLSEPAIALQFSMSFTDLILEKIEGIASEQYVIFEDEGILNVASEKENQSFLLCFKALTDGSLSEKLIFTNSGPEALLFNVAGIPSSLELRTTTGKTNIVQAVLLSTAPNPFTERLDLAFSLNTSSEVQIQLSDALGRIVYEVNQQFSEGNNTYRINAPDIPQGMYLVEIKTDSGGATKAVLKVD